MERVINLLIDDRDSRCCQVCVHRFTCKVDDNMRRLIDVLEDVAFLDEDERLVFHSNEKGCDTPFCLALEVLVAEYCYWYKYDNDA